MSARADMRRPAASFLGRWDVLSLAALVVWLVVLVPPVGTLARRYVVVEAVQFTVLGAVAPALLVLGAPWRRRRRPDGIAEAGGAAEGAGQTRLGAIADARLRHRGAAFALPYLALFVGVLVAWRVPAAVNALHDHPWLSLLEAVALLATGVLAWVEFVPSPPFRPRVVQPLRFLLNAVPMWTCWISGYLIGFAQDPWYTAYRHVAGQGLSANADQQLAAGVLFFVPLVTYAPAIFVGILGWLRNSEDPDEELHLLLRSERRRRPWGGPSTS